MGAKNLYIHHCYYHLYLTCIFHSVVDAKYVEVDGYNYQGNDLPTVGAYTIQPSFEACASKCFQTSGCVGFSYSDSNNGCWAKSRMVAENLIFALNFRSGLLKGTFRFM